MDNLFLLLVYIAFLSFVLAIGAFVCDYVLPKVQRIKRMAEYNETVDRR